MADCVPRPRDFNNMLSVMQTKLVTRVGHVGLDVDPSHTGPDVTGAKTTATKKKRSAAAAFVAGSGSAKLAVLSPRKKAAKKKKKKIGEWSKEEHALFLEGAKALGGDDWVGIAANFVKSRSARQVKCHALTYDRTEEWNIDEHSRFLKGVKVAGRGEFTYIAKHFVKTRNAREVQEYADSIYSEAEAEKAAGRKRKRKLSLYCYRKYSENGQKPAEENEVGDHQADQQQQQQEHHHHHHHHHQQQQQREQAVSA